MTRIESSDTVLSSLPHESFRLHGPRTLEPCGDRFDQTAPPQPLAQMPGFAWTTDRTLTVQTAQGAEMSKVDPYSADIVGRTIPEIFPEAGAVSPSWAHRGALNGEIRAFEFRRGAQTFYGLAAPLYDAQENLVGTSAVALDISALRQAEKIEAQAREADKIHALQRFAGGIAHNFNNLLTVILGYAHLAKMDARANSPARRHLEKLEAAAECLAHLTGGISCFGQKSMAELQPVSLTGIVEASKESLRQLVPEAIELRYGVAQNLPLIEGDPGQLRQVLAVLVANASEATNTAGGTIDIDTNVVHVDRLFLAGLGIADEAAEGEYVRLQVSDSGCGLDAEARQHLFEPFFSTKFTGRGMGLSTAHSIVKDHAGILAVSSALGVGTTFHVLLPCEDSARARQSGPAVAR